MAFETELLYRIFQSLDNCMWNAHRGMELHFVLTAIKTDTQFIIQDRDLGEKVLFIKETGTLSRINPSYPEAPVLLNTTRYVHTEKFVPHFI
jgi:hypothetical protein